jgi:hypothetical protein
MAKGIKNMSINHWSNKNLLIINGTPFKARHLIGVILAAPLIWAILYVALAI